MRKGQKEQECVGKEVRPYCGPSQTFFWSNGALWRWKSPSELFCIRQNKPDLCIPSWISFRMWPSLKVCDLRQGSSCSSGHSRTSRWLTMTGRWLAEAVSLSLKEVLGCQPARLSQLPSEIILWLGDVTLGWQLFSLSACLWLSFVHIDRCAVKLLILGIPPEACVLLSAVIQICASLSWSITRMCPGVLREFSESCLPWILDDYQQSLFGSYFSTIRSIFSFWNACHVHFTRSLCTSHVSSSLFHVFFLYA